MSARGRYRAQVTVMLRRMIAATPLPKFNRPLPPFYLLLHTQIHFPWHFLDRGEKRTIIMKAVLKVAEYKKC